MPALRVLLISFLLFLSIPVWCASVNFVEALFCHPCTINSEGLMSEPETDDLQLIKKLQDFEAGINVMEPEKSTVPYKIVGSGSTTLGLVIESLPDKLVRRLSGFLSPADAALHVGHIHYYRERLHQLDIATTETQLIALESVPYTLIERKGGGQGIVYVVQPFLSADRLARPFLQGVGEGGIKAFFDLQMAIADKILNHNAGQTDDVLSIDIVMNNWEVFHNPDGTQLLRLNDFAQPLYSEGGHQLYDWYDQASTIIYPFAVDAQRELRKQLEKLLDPREFLQELLWGYESLHHVYSDNCTSEERKNSAPYPCWAMRTVNDRLRTFNLTELNGEEVIIAFKNNNYAIACLWLFRRASSLIRGWLGYFRLANPIHIQKPTAIPVDMYQTGGSPGILDYWQCFCNPEKKYHYPSGQRDL